MALQSCCKLRIDILVSVPLPIDQPPDAGRPEGGNRALGKNALFSQGQFPKKCLAVSSQQSVFPASGESAPPSAWRVPGCTVASSTQGKGACKVKFENLQVRKCYLSFFMHDYSFAHRMLVQRNLVPLTFKALLNCILTPSKWQAITKMAPSDPHLLVVISFCSPLLLHMGQICYSISMNRIMEKWGDAVFDIGQKDCGFYLGPSTFHSLSVLLS